MLTIKHHIACTTVGKPTILLYAATETDKDANRANCEINTTWCVKSSLNVTINR